MQLESKKRLSIQERTYRALAEIAKKTKHTEVNELIVTDAVLNWTIDPVRRSEDGALEAETEESEDLTTLFSYVVSHLNGQRQTEDALEVAKRMAQRMALLDTESLSEKDPEEWGKLTQILDDQSMEGVVSEIPDTLDDFLAQLGDEAIEEGTADEVARAALIHRVDSQAKAAQLLSFFLTNVHEENHDVVHGIINQYGCVLVHIIVSLLISWVESRSTLPADLSLEQWFVDLGEMGARAESLSEDEKVDLGRHYLEHEEGDDD